MVPELEFLNRNPAEAPTTTKLGSVSETERHALGTWESLPVSIVPSSPRKHNMAQLRKYMKSFRDPCVSHAVN